MRRILPLFAVGLLLVGLVGVFSVTQATSMKAAGLKTDTPTVGEFMVRYAQSSGLGTSHTTPAEALATLRASGRVGTAPVDLDARLTEGDVVRLTQSANLGIASENATREFSRVQTNTFFSVFSSSLKNTGSAASSTSTTASNNRGKDKTADPSANSCPPNTNPNNCNGVDPRTRGKGKKKGLSNHFPF